MLKVIALGLGLAVMALLGSAVASSHDTAMRLLITK